MSRRRLCGVGITCALVALALWTAVSRLHASASFSYTAGEASTLRLGDAVVRLTDGRVLIAGGFDGNFTITNTAELYDPTSQTFTPLNPMQLARVNHAMALLPDGRVLVVGGDQPGHVKAAQAELFDPVLGTFTLTGVLNV
ncbi:MAG TPA: kelch repeat-containing protein, partial [Vicinamibacterales bacterium]|nr:kelch repeat-containing protein [Vicinamibacterales bacterium]